tara:strand:- start:625 stop:1128 length:504 start_codon:yes stop_codon:yes gene_type:complete
MYPTHESRKIINKHLSKIKVTTLRTHEQLMDKMTGLEVQSHGTTAMTVKVSNNLELNKLEMLTLAAGGIFFIWINRVQLPLMNIISLNNGLDNSRIKAIARLSNRFIRTFEPIELGLLDDRYIAVCGSTNSDIVIPVTKKDLAFMDINIKNITIHDKAPTKRAYPNF